MVRFGICCFVLFKYSMGFKRTEFVLVCEKFETESEFGKATSSIWILAKVSCFSCVESLASKMFSFWRFYAFSGSSPCAISASYYLFCCSVFFGLLATMFATSLKYPVLSYLVAIGFSCTFKVSFSYLFNSRYSLSSSRMTKIFSVLDWMWNGFSCCCRLSDVCFDSPR